MRGCVCARACARLHVARAYVRVRALRTGTQRKHLGVLAVFQAVFEVAGVDARHEDASPPVALSLAQHAVAVEAAVCEGTVVVHSAVVLSRPDAADLTWYKKSAIVWVKFNYT